MLLFLLEFLFCVLYLFFMQSPKINLLKVLFRGRLKVPIRSARESIQGKGANLRAPV